MVSLLTTHLLLVKQRVPRQLLNFTLTLSLPRRPKLDTLVFYSNTPDNFTCQKRSFSSDRVYLAYSEICLLNATKAAKNAHFDILPCLTHQTILLVKEEAPVVKGLTTKPVFLISFSVIRSLYLICGIS